MLKKSAIGVLTLLISALPLSAIAKADTVSTNLIPNASLETSTSGTTPDSWQTSNYSTVANGNAATFTYLNTGHTGNRSTEVQVTKFTDGDANWFYSDIPVTAGTTYEYSDWYQSNVDTEIDAEVVINGVTQYFKVGTAFASSTWKDYTGTFTAPAGATSMSLYHLIAGVGYLITDDYSMAAYTPAPFNRAMVSVTFDDGWLNQYNNAAPIMKSDGLTGTYYIISDPSVTTPDPEYMNATDVKNLFAQGNEIGSHTVHHCDLTGIQSDDPDNCPLPISATQVNQEMQNSQTTLQNLIGAPVTDFAYPYGAYNSSTLAVGQQYYQSQRTVNAGYNTKDSFDATQLKMYEVDSNITQAQVQAWIDGAIANHTWLILCYHEVATAPTDPADDDALYTTQPADFSAEMSYLKGTGVATETVSQALKEAQNQTSPADTTPPVISGVANTGVTATDESVNWTTDEASTTQVNYGTTTAYGSSTTLDSTLATTHTTALTGLTSGTTYHYQVGSRDAAGNTTPSGDYTFTTAVIPPVISNVTVTGVTDSSAILNWTTDEASTSQVSYGSTDTYGTATTSDASLVTSHSVTLTGLTANTAYHYEVTSAAAAGSPVNSTDATFTTTATPDTTKPVISNVAPNSITPTTANLTWTTDEASTSQIAYGSDTAYNDQPVATTVLSTSHSITVTGLTANTTYHYQVISTDVAGNIAKSTDYTFATSAASTIPIPGDITGNGVVDDDDATVMFANWGPVASGMTNPSDLNHNGAIDDDDATILFGNWSK